MSSLIYGIVTAKRSVAPAGQSQSDAAPGMGTYVDTLAALVPAEALALYAGFVVPYTTQTVSVDGEDMTVISDPRLLQWSCVGLLALSSLLYLVGRRRVLLKPSDLLRLFIPPTAFTGWMLVQNPGVWDSWWPGSSLGERTVVAAFAAVVLGVAASLLGQQADGSGGMLAVTGVCPRDGSVAGGTRVTVTGSGFSDATEVKFGRAVARHLIVNSDGELTVTSPEAHEPGPVNVVVVTAAGASTRSAADHFSYEAERRDRHGPDRDGHRTGEERAAAEPQPAQPQPAG
jgi:hypothetical protein